MLFRAGGELVVLFASFAKSSSFTAHTRQPCHSEERSDEESAFGTREKADASLRSVENHPLSHACTVAGSLGVIWTL
jgi:hypothetical protein